MAAAEVEAAAGVDDVRLTATATAALGRAPTREPTRTLTTEVGLARALPTGGTASVQLTGTEARDPADPDPPFRATASLQLVQPLLAGVGRNASGAARARAALALEVARLARVRVASTVARDALVDYWELAFAWQELAVRARGVALAEEQLRVTRARIRQGQSAPSDALAVEQGLAGRQAQVVRARLAVRKRSLALRARLGLEIAPDAIELATDPIPDLDDRADPRELADELRRATAGSPEIAELAARERGATIDVEVTANGTLPALDLTVLAGPTAAADSAGAAARDLVGATGYRASASLELRWDLGRHASTGAAGRARATRQRARIDLAAARAQLATAVVDAVGQRDTAAAVVALATREIALAGQGISAEQSRFDLNKASAFDVLARQQDLVDAELRRARALVDHAQARAAIDALTGALARRLATHPHR